MKRGFWCVMRADGRELNNASKSPDISMPFTIGRQVRMRFVCPRLDVAFDAVVAHQILEFVELDMPLPLRLFLPRVHWTVTYL